jgi:hypothetical protein
MEIPAGQTKGPEWELDPIGTRTQSRKKRSPSAVIGCRELNAVANREVSLRVAIYAHSGEPSSRTIPLHQRPFESFISRGEREPFMVRPGSCRVGVG